MKKQKRKHTIENKPLMSALQGLRRSNAAAPHILKKYKGSRRERKMKALQDYDND